MSINPISKTGPAEAAGQLFPGACHSGCAASVELLSDSWRQKIAQGGTRLVLTALAATLMLPNERAWAGAVEAGATQNQELEASRLRRNWNSKLSLADGTNALPLPSPQAINRPRTTTVPAQARRSPFRKATAGVEGTLSPAVIDNDYFGDVRLDITGLDNGETVLVKKYLVFNGAGTIDGDSILQQSLTLVDGQAAAIGGVVNPAVAADTTPADGAIAADLSFLDRFSSHIVGNYVYEISSPTSRFAPVVTTFTVAEHAFAQKFTGTAKDSAGNPVPRALVLLLDSSSGNPDFVAGTVADENGQYQLATVPGAYQVVAAKTGYVSDFGAGSRKRLVDSETKTVDPVITVADRVIAGQVSDFDNAALGLGGVLVTLQSEDDGFTFVFTDANGNFSAGVKDGKWEVQVLDRAANQLGYVSPSGNTTLTVQGADITGRSIKLQKANALLHGRVLTPALAPVAHADVDGFSLDRRYGAFATTDAQGRYVLAVRAGAWQAGVLSDSVDEQGFMSAGAIGVKPVAGQAVATDLTVYPATARLKGRITYNDGSPVAYGGVQALKTTGVFLYTQVEADEDGYFDVAVVAGVWQLAVPKEEAEEENLVVASGADVTVAVGQTLENLSLVARPATRNINLTVLDSQGETVSEVRVTATATDTGATYTGHGVPEEDETFTLPAFEGTWQIALNAFDLEEAGLFAPTTAPVVVPAGDDDVEVTINLLTLPEITWSNPANVLPGTVLGATQLNATADVPGVFTYSPAAGQVLASGLNQSLVVTFVPTDSVHYAPRSKTVHINVVNAPPVIAGTGGAQFNIMDKQTAQPFASVSVTDADTPTRTLTVTLAVDNRFKGRFTTLSGFTATAPGSYTFSGTAAAATTALHGLIFTPNENRVSAGATETTTFTLTVNDGVNTPVSDATVTVTATSINDPPLARGLRIEFTPDGQPLYVAVGKLLANAHDPDPETLALVSFDTLSANDGSINLNGAWQALEYIVPTGFTGTDTFGFTVQDGAGQTATATVTVIVKPASDSQTQNLAGIVTLGGGTKRVTFAGFPNSAYRVQATESLATPNWTLLGDVTSGANGLIVYDDTDAPNHSQRFYRAVVLFP